MPFLLSGKAVILAGDLNISHRYLDTHYLRRAVSIDKLLQLYPSPTQQSKVSRDQPLAGLSSQELKVNSNEMSMNDQADIETISMPLLHIQTILNKIAQQVRQHWECVTKSLNQRQVAPCQVRTSSTRGNAHGYLERFRVHVDAGPLGRLRCYLVD